jgi:hypothetical protein
MRIRNDLMYRVGSTERRLWPPPAAISNASRQRMVIKGSDVWYRVAVGPFNDLKSLQGARQRLTEGCFNYMLAWSNGEGAG